MSHSSNVPASSSSSMRSRAVSLPFACCASMRFWPPPRRARQRFVELAAHLGVVAERVAQAGVDPLPQPAARLAAASLVKRAALLLRGAERLDRAPDLGHLLGRERGARQHA